jgi:hypothetical protein
MVPKVGAKVTKGEIKWRELKVTLEFTSRIQGNSLIYITKQVV